VSEPTAAFGTASRDADPGERAPAGTVTVANVSHGFGRGRDHLAVLDGVSLEVEGGGALALVGPSGCGKSTLLELVAGLAEPQRGEISVLGARSARERCELCVYMPQRDSLLPWRDALGNAALALECRGVARREAQRRAAPLFGALGLAGFERAWPHQLSGGMRQRVAFVRTLLAGKPVLLLDEPFAALDALTRVRLQEWLRGVLTRERRTVVLVTHDVEEALFLADRVALLSPRPARVLRVFELGPRPPRRRDLFSEDRLRAVYAQALELLADASER